MRILVLLTLVLCAGAARAADVCSSPCHRWSETRDCSPNCPPCRLPDPSGPTPYSCWDYLGTTPTFAGACPMWAGIVDCKRPDAPAVIPSEGTSTVGNPGATVPPLNRADPDTDHDQDKPPGEVVVTIFNLCDGYDIFYNGQRVPDDCLNGNYCGRYTGGNPAFYAKKPGDRAEQGFTLVELNLPAGRNVWYDISRVTGFNVGAEIEYRYFLPKRGGLEHDATDIGHTIICSDVNCDDAYHLCDIAEQNKFNPVYNNPGGGAFIISFCPERDEPDGDVTSVPLVPSSIGNPRKQPDPTAGPFTCACKLNLDERPGLVHELPGVIVYGGAL